MRWHKRFINASLKRFSLLTRAQARHSRQNCSALKTMCLHQNMCRCFATCALKLASIVKRTCHCKLKLLHLAVNIAGSPGIRNLLRSLIYRCGLLRIPETSKRRWCRYIATSIQNLELCLSACVMAILIWEHAQASHMGAKNGSSLSLACLTSAHILQAHMRMSTC